MGKTWIPPPQPQAPPEGEKPPSHDPDTDLEFECDYCDREIAVGEERYRCAHCEDFDVCASCAKSKKHKHYLWLMGKVEKKKKKKRKKQRRSTSSSSEAAPKKRRKLRSPSPKKPKKSPNKRKDVEKNEKPAKVRSEKVEKSEVSEPRRRSPSSKTPVQKSPKKADPPTDSETAEAKAERRKANEERRAKKLAEKEAAKRKKEEEEAAERKRKAVEAKKQADEKKQREGHKAAEERKEAGEIKQKHVKNEVEAAKRREDAEEAKRAEKIKKDMVAAEKLEEAKKRAAGKKRAEERAAEKQMEEAAERGKKEGVKATEKELEKAAEREKKEEEKKAAEKKIEEAAEREKEEAKKAAEETEEAELAALEREALAQAEEEEEEAMKRKKEEDEEEEEEAEKNEEKEEQKRKEAEEKKKKEEANSAEAAQKNEAGTKEKVCMEGEAEKLAERVTPKREPEPVMVVNAKPVDEAVKWLYGTFTSAVVTTDVLHPHKLSDELDVRVATGKPADFEKLSIGKKPCKQGNATVMNLSWWGCGEDSMTHAAWAPSVAPVLGVLTNNVTDKVKDIPSSYYVLLAKFSKAGQALDAVEGYRPSLASSGAMTSFAWLEKEIKGCAGLAACTVVVKKKSSKGPRSHVCVMKLPVPSQYYVGDGLRCNEVTALSTLVSGEADACQWVPSEQSCTLVVSGTNTGASVAYLMSFSVDKLQHSQLLESKFSALLSRSVTVQGIVRPVLLNVEFGAPYKGETAYSVWGTAQGIKKISEGQLPEASTVAWPASLGSPVVGMKSGGLTLLLPTGAYCISQSPTAIAHEHDNAVLSVDVCGRDLVWLTAGGLVLKTSVPKGDTCTSCVFKGGWLESPCSCLSGAVTQTVGLLQGVSGAATLWMSDALPLSLQGDDLSGRGLCPACLMPEELNFCRVTKAPHGSLIGKKGLKAAASWVDQAMETILNEPSGQYAVGVPESSDGLALGDAIVSLKDAKGERSLLAVGRNHLALIDKKSGAVLLSQF